MFTEAMINNMTAAEKIRYAIPIEGDDLLALKDEIIDDHHASIESKYESAMEQSQFRAECIREILALFESKSWRYTETKDLIARIKNHVEESYVEL